jgi:hypothetical protein
VEGGIMYIHTITRHGSKYCNGTFNYESIYMEIQ